MSIWLRRYLRALTAVAWSLAALASVQAGQEADLDELPRLLTAGHYAEALPIAQRLLSAAETEFGNDHPNVATALDILALTYERLGRSSEVEPILRRSLVIKENALGPEHPQFKTALDHVAEFYWTRGRYGEAEPLYSRSLAITERTAGPNHPDVGEALNFVGRLYRVQGRYAEAEVLYKRSLGIFETALGPEHPRVAIALNNLAVLYQSEGRFGEAESLLLRGVALREKALGPDSPQLATSLNNLGQLYSELGRYGQAEQELTRSLAIREKALGPNHVDVAESLNNLAGLMQSLGRYREAEPLFKRALAIWERTSGSDHPDVGMALNNLAKLYAREDRYADAEPLYLRSLSILERSLGPEHPNLAHTLSNLGHLYESQGRYGDAEPLYMRSLTIKQKALGGNHPDLAAPLIGLAGFYQGLGRYGEAEPLNKRALDIVERALGTEHAHVATALMALGDLYFRQARYVDAAPLYERSLAILEKALGSLHPNVGTSLANLGNLNIELGQYGRAESLLNRSLAINEKSLGSEHSDTASVLHTLAGLKLELGRYGEAESLFKRCITITEKTLGADHPTVAPSLNNLAQVYQRQGRYEEARYLYQRSLDIAEKAFGPRHPLLATALNNLAWLALARHDWAGAAELWKRTTQVHLDRAALGLTGDGEVSPGRETSRYGWQFSGLVKMTYRLAPDGVGKDIARAKRAFDTAQWAQRSETAAAVTQMAARGAKGSAELAALVRERQDLAAEWQVKDRVLVAAKGRAPGVRKPEAEAEIAGRVAAIEARLAEISARFAKEFPDYATLASIRSTPATEVQANLGDDEALVFLLGTDERFNLAMPEETFVWVVTRSNIRWVRSSLGTRALQEYVATLRCGLDRDGEWAWTPAKQRWSARKVACEELQPEGLANDDPLPFEPAIAHALYKALLGEVEDVIAGKHLLIVPSGALTSLPFQVLVTRAPVPGQPLRSLAWLAREHASTVLPSVSSLTTLRRNAGASPAPEPFIGFGDPILSGRCGPVHIPRTCPDEDIALAKAQAPAARRTGMVRSAPDYFHDGLADVAALRKACPLPDTAHELRCVARSLGASPSSLVLGKDMTEAVVKKMPLDHYRIVHFATHGLLAGDTERFTKTRAEPALLFTPPENATDEDDGLLTASEIAGLKLDADWVVMSACNTAGGDKPGAEALSGLAKAFFYAGARALLVSHWPVNTNAATLLTSRTFAELRRDKSIGRAEAFRRAMLALIDDKQRPWAAHPSVWAPFIVVGEGGAVR